jgi:hypothetical protein
MWNAWLAPSYFDNLTGTKPLVSASWPWLPILNLPPDESITFTGHPQSIPASLRLELLEDREKTPNYKNQLSNGLESPPKSPRSSSHTFRNFLLLVVEKTADVGRKFFPRTLYKEQR